MLYEHEKITLEVLMVITRDWRYNKYVGSVIMLEQHATLRTIPLPLKTPNMKAFIPTSFITSCLWASVAAVPTLLSVEVSRKDELLERKTGGVSNPLI